MYKADFILDLDIPYNKQNLLQECNQVTEWITYHEQTPGFLRTTLTDLTHYPEMKRVAEQLKNILNVEVTTSFFKKEKDNDLVPHKDPSHLLCSINILLEGSEPIIFPDYGEVHYSCALVNIQQYHALTYGSRKIAKFCVKEKDYYECREIFISS